MHRRLPLITFVLIAGLIFGVAVSSAAAVLNASPTSVSFGDQKVGTTSSDSTVHITNTGDADLMVATVSASDTTVGSTGEFAVSSNGCGTVPPAGGCDITVTFSPASAGAKTGVLSISSNAGATVVSLTGNGAVPQASVDASVSFATPRNVPQTKSVTLTNTGNAVLDVAGATLTGDATFTNAGTGDCGNAQLQPSHSCSAQITFLPTTAGTSNATVTFTDDDGSVAGSTQAVALQGNALLPSIQATPTSVSFPGVALGRITNVRHVVV